MFGIMYFMGEYVWKRLIIWSQLAPASHTDSCCGAISSRQPNSKPNKLLLYITSQKTTLLMKYRTNLQISLHPSYMQSMQSADEMFPNILPTSWPAKKISCGRNKVSSITECALDHMAQEVVLKHLQTTSYYSIGSDTWRRKWKKCSTYLCVSAAERIK